MDKQTLQITIPKIDKKWLWSKPFLFGCLALFALGSITYWWKAVRPFYRTTEGILVVSAMQIYPTAEGRIEFSLQEGQKFETGQSMFTMIDAHLAHQMAEIMRKITLCKDHFEKEKNRLDQLMQRYIQFQHSLEVDAILMQVKEAQEKSSFLEEELQRLHVEKSAIQKKIDALQVLAPYDGVVLRHLKTNGERAETDKPVLVICNVKEKWVEIEIPENFLGRVRIGADALIEFSSFEGQKWRGSIAWISPLVEQGKIRMKLSAPALPLQPGLSAKASIQIDS